MTHDEALRALLVGAGAPTGGAPLSAGTEREAEEHLIECGECWDVVHSIRNLVGGGPPSSPQDVSLLDRCRHIQPRLPLVADIPASDLRRREPDVVAHVESCRTCREELIDFQAVAEHDAELAMPPTARPRWGNALSRSGQKLLDLAGEFVVRVRDGVVAVGDWPDGLFPVPVGVPISRKRGPKRSTGAEPPAAQKFEIPLGEEGLEINVVFEPHEGRRATLSITVVKGARSFTVDLRRVENEQEQLVAAQQSKDPSAEFIASGLRPGRYHLVVGDRASSVRYRIAFRMEPT